MSEPVTKEALQEVGKLFHDFKAINEKKHESSEARAKELEEVMRKINSRMDEVETALSRPARAAKEVESEMEQELHGKQDRAFRTYLRDGARGLSPDEAKALQTRVVIEASGKKALATDNLTTGGYFMPMNMSNEVAELLVEYDPIRQIADVESISEGDTWTGLKEGTTLFSSSWVAERGSRAETTAGTFEEDKIPTHEQYANPFVTQKQIDDPKFNIQAYAAKKIAEVFGVAEGLAFVSGSGVTRPLGFTSTLPGTTSVETVTGGVSATIDTDDMLSLIAELPEAYARNAAFLMRRATKFVLRKLKDGNGQYLWQPSLQIGTPPSFDGIPVYESPNVAAVGASAKAVILADWKKFYKIIDRQGMRTVPDPFTNKPYVELYTTRRVGGQVRLPEAGKILTCGA